MLNFLKKSKPSSPVYKCILCNNTFTESEMSPVDSLCDACSCEASDNFKSLINKIEKLQEMDEEAGNAGNLRGQMSFYKLILKYMYDYKEAYYDKGINLVSQDFNQMIQNAQMVYDGVLEILLEDSKQRNIILEEDNIPLTDEQWFQLLGEQHSAIDKILSMCDTMDRVGIGFSDGRSVGTQFLEMAIELLIYLSVVDGEIDEVEKQIIMELLQVDDIDYYIQAVEKRVKENGPYSLEIPECMDVFIKADQKLIRNGSDSAAAISVLILLKEMGILFLYRSCSDIVPEKIAELYQYLLNINNLLAMNYLPMDSLEEFCEAEIEEVAVKDLNTQDTQESLEELMAELNGLIGLDRVKSDLNSLINLIKVQKMREERGFKRIPISLHLVFSGNPGTGKTTVARLLARIYKSLGLISTGQLIETDRSGLVAGYVGQTAIKTQEIISKAKGGILFIDEAYSLTENGGNEDYGQEAIDILVKAMEDGRADLVVIVAGYPKEMENFLNSNTGLRSRFNKFIEFDDYSAEDLILILKTMCTKAGLTLSDKAEQQAYSYYVKQKSMHLPAFANARDVRNYYEKALVNQANRLSRVENVTDSMLFSIEYDDLVSIALETE
ncbi:AAA family ATPase [Anaerocolumna chitinilytica]|uniref:AAA+ ATPase domain-containing protein n=1 Tax=Anaerocolumna chitinilytica TaxID=1727145 RepID=A0A7I8DJ92_9FIRM|nr:AAA family ATPase [Anaerocolumna chitinilytica]BCJ97767.1 hypothetical protein bsdcttw_08080 [Anaerocolumna chitinilytica]